MEEIIKKAYSLNTFKTPVLAAKGLAELLLSYTEKTIQENSRCIWAVSGGNSILKIYDALLAQKDRLIEFSEHLVVLWVDERNVPHSHPDSNFGNAYSYFWEKFKNVRLVPIPYLKNIEESALEYNKKLQDLHIGRENIDITVLGMGEDGHTASLFPSSNALFEKKKPIVTLTDSKLNQNRITMTYSLLNSSESIFLFFYGPQKSKTLREAVLSTNVSKYPVLGIRKENLQVYHSPRK